MARKVNEPFLVHRVRLNHGYAEASSWKRDEGFGNGAPSFYVEMEPSSTSFIDSVLGVELTSEAEQDASMDVYEKVKSINFIFSPSDAVSFILLLLSHPEIADAWEEHRALTALEPLDASKTSP